MESINFDKGNGLVPAIIQDTVSKNVLMLGYMNAEALKKTLNTGYVTFFSRSKNRLWTKGETSGNYLKIDQYLVDCDRDTLLILASPVGAVCHTGKQTCFKNENTYKGAFLDYLEEIITKRKEDSSHTSYTRQLLDKGINKVAQKVGEEAVELVIEAKDANKTLFMGEAADLLYHFMVLLAAKGYKFSDVIDVLSRRHKQKK